MESTTDSKRFDILEKINGLFNSHGTLYVGARPGPRRDTGNLV